MMLKEMLQIKEFEGMKILAGHSGINKTVKSVTVIDAPDIDEWLKGGEILMSSGYLIKDNPELFAKMIYRIHEAGATALLIKVDRFIKNIPAKVAKVADEIGFPIIYMPISLAWIDVINPVLSRIINEQHERATQAHAIHDQFTKIVAGGGDINEIVRTAYNITGHHFLYWDIMFDEYYSSLDDDILKENITEIKDIQNIHDNQEYEYYALKEQGRLLGYLYCLTKKNKLNEYIDKDRRQLLQIAMEHAGTVIDLFIQKKCSNLAIENRYRNEFVQDLITNNINYLEEIHRRAEVYNWNLNNGRLAVIVDIDNYKEEYRKLSISNRLFYYTLEALQDNIFRLANTIIQNDFKDVIYCSFSDSIVFLVDYGKFEKKKEFEDQIKITAKKVCEKISNKYSFTVSVGIGTYKDSIMNIHESYQEAKKSIKISRMLNKTNTYIYYKELGVYELLANISELQSVKDFCNKTLIKIYNYDTENNGNLLDTLNSIIQFNWNLRKTSKEIFLHYNTIKYRYKKIEDILGEDLSDSNVRIKLAISMKLFEINEYISI